MPPKTNRPDQAPENVEEKTTSTRSARTTNKNSNSPKKVRSRVPRSQWNNSFSSIVSGSLTRQIAYGPGGKLIEAIEKLYGSLQRRFDMNDVVGALLVDLLIADFWRLSECIKREKQMMYEPQSWPFSPSGSAPTLARYMTAARRNLDNTLKTLRDLEKEAAEAGTLEAEFAEAEPEASNSSAPETSTADCDVQACRNRGIRGVRGRNGRQRGAQSLLSSTLQGRPEAPTEGSVFTVS